MIEIPLTRGLSTQIDKEDHEVMCFSPWHASEVSPGKIYAASQYLGKTIYLHRLITNAPKGMVVDHIDGNGLNNQRNNLRVCLHRENVSNRSGRQVNNTTGYTGVVRTASPSKWAAKIKHKGGKIHIGVFDTPEEAARARDAMAKKLHGPFVCLNFKEEI